MTWSFADVKKAVSCERYITEVMGCEIQNNRIQARWRGGDGWNVQINEDSVHDYKTKETMSVIDLCMKDKGMDKLAALRFLGEKFNVTPIKKASPKKDWCNIRKRLEAQGQFPMTTLVFVQGAWQVFFS